MSQGPSAWSGPVVAPAEGEGRSARALAALAAHDGEAVHSRGGQPISADSSIPDAHNAGQGGWGRFWLRAASHTGAMVVAVGLACLAMWLFTRNNDFPVGYHPDEASKAWQLLDPRGHRNFNHPLLMLRAAECFNLWWQPGPEVRDVVIAGRHVSALLSAIAVWALAMSGYVVLRWWGLLLVGVVMALCPPLLVYAHYFKEDTSLIAGVAVVVLGMVITLTARRSWAQLAGALILGIGCALAAGGKYLGVVAVIPACAAIVAAPFGSVRDKTNHLRRFWLIPIQLLAAAGVGVPLFVVINQTAFEDPWSLRVHTHVASHVEGEFEHATSEHGGVGMFTPNAFWAEVAASEVVPTLWAMLLLGLGVWAMRPRLSRWGVGLVLMIVCFGGALSFNAIPFERYALPVTVLSHTAIAMLFAAMASRLAAGRWKIAAISVFGLAVVATVVVQGWRCMALNGQIADDSRQRLREWVATLPPGTRIVADNYTDLGSRGDPWRFPDQARVRQYIVRRGYVAEGGSLDEMRRRGMQYVAIAGPSFNRYLLRWSMPAAGREAEFYQFAAFYRDLLDNHTPVWQSDPDPPSNAYINPVIRVYRIDTPRSPEPDAP